MPDLERIWYRELVVLMLGTAFCPHLNYLLIRSPVSNQKAPYASEKDSREFQWWCSETSAEVNATAGTQTGGRCILTGISQPSIQISVLATPLNCSHCSVKTLILLRCENLTIQKSGETLRIHAVCSPNSYDLHCGYNEYSPFRQENTELRPLFH
jgi:hypothetical protein